MYGKKNLVAVLVGTFIMVGVAIPYIGEAAPMQGEPPKCGPDMMIQRMTDDFGLNKDEVAKYVNQKVDHRELMHAAMLTKISGKSLTDILSMKTLAKTWEDIEQTLGVTKEQIHAFRENAIATKLASNLAVSKDVVAALMKKGYHPNDISVATILSKETKKPLAKILSMKAINNSWSDVAKSLGVNEAALRQDLDKYRESMPGVKGAGPGNCGPDMMGMRDGGPAEPERQK
jgi:hypothetical protein